MRRLIKIALVALGIRAFLRWRKKRREAHGAPAQAAADPADELRRKLAAAREEETAAATEPYEPPAAAVADRRAEVHEQGRAALDDMTSSTDS